MCGEVADVAVPPPTLSKNQFQINRNDPTLPKPIFLRRKRQNQKYKAWKPSPDHGLPLPLACRYQIAISCLRHSNEG